MEAIRNFMEWVIRAEPAILIFLLALACLAVTALALLVVGRVINVLSGNRGH